MARQLTDRAKHLFWTNRIKLTDQFGLVEQIEAPKTVLPEYLFLGSTNVGKSSLMSALLNPPRRHAAAKSVNNEFPRVSARAGFTETISLYTIGRLMRLADSPGYGYKSTSKQGNVVSQYLDVRGNIVRHAYLLVHAKRGLSDQDRAVGGMLSAHGVPFKFVITKSDLSANTDQVGEQLANMLSDLRLPALSELFVTSTKQGLGIDELRADLLLSSGLLEAKAL